MLVVVSVFTEPHCYLLRGVPCLCVVLVPSLNQVLIALGLALAFDCACCTLNKAQFKFQLMHIIVGYSVQ